MECVPPSNTNYSKYEFIHICRSTTNDMHINNMENSCTRLHSAKLTWHLNINGWVTFTAGTRYLCCRCMLLNSRDIHRDGGSSNQHLHVFTGSCLQLQETTESQNSSTFKISVKQFSSYYWWRFNMLNHLWSISSLISETGNWTLRTNWDSSAINSLLKHKSNCSNTFLVMLDANFRTGNQSPNI